MPRKKNASPPEPREVDVEAIMIWLAGGAGDGQRKVAVAAVTPESGVLGKVLGRLGLEGTALHLPDSDDVGLRP